MRVKEQTKSHKEKWARCFLDSLTGIAIKNANSDCRGFMYEPKVPEKLKK